MVAESGLHTPTLVLNKNWTAIDACTAKEGITKVIADQARIICPESFELFDIRRWMDRPIPANAPVIRGVRQEIAAPKVIINQYGRIPRRVVVCSRHNIWRRDGFRCQYCGIHPSPDEITLDHVLPKSRGGTTSFENCVLACVDCNKKKNDRTPAEAGMRLRKRPKRPAWSPIYAMKRQKIPADWSKFLQGVIDDLYWNTELEP